MQEEFRRIGDEREIAEVEERAVFRGGEALIDLVRRGAKRGSSEMRRPIRKIRKALTKTEIINL